MAPNPRVAKAFRAMREIGIIEEKVKPVLKNLLKLYEKNWQLIEAENYRALADAIFEQEESQVVEQKRKHERADIRDMEEEAEGNEEPERPLKRSRRIQEGQAMSSIGNPSSMPNGTLLKQPKEEVVELPDETQAMLSCPPLVRKKGKQPMLHDLSTNAADRTVALATNGTRSGTVSPTSYRWEKGKEPISSHSPPSYDRSTPAACLKESVVPGTILLRKQKANNSSALIKPKDEPVREDVPHLLVPLAAIHPETLDTENPSLLGDSIRKPDCPASLASHSVQDGIQSDGMPASSKDWSTNHATSTIVDESLSKFLVVSPNSREETVNVTPAIDVQKQRNGALDVLDVTDKAIGPDNESFTSENVYEVAQTVVPMHSPSFNGDNCNNTLKDTDKRISEVDREKELNDLEHVNSHDHVVHQDQPTSVGGKPFHDVVDIANGQERVVISFVNEVNDEDPPSFHYIPRNVVFQNAYVNFSLARIGENCCSTCSGNCLSSPIPCACAHESGGEYAYTSEGLVKEDILKESVSMNRDPENHCQFYCNDCPLERVQSDGVVEPCQGHLVRRFIKECWWKCGCDNQCGNRVVQRGINRKLQVFMTPEGKGWGLRTLEDLPEGAFVCEYVGEILTNTELFERVSQRRSSGEVHAYPVLLDADWGAEGVLKDEEALCLDATHYGNVGRFINHRCVDSNMVEIPVEVETPDHHYYHLAFFTTRKVNALEELTWDYGIDFDNKDHPVKAFKCRCGSKLCRNMKRYNRSRSRSRRRR